MLPFTIVTQISKKDYVKAIMAHYTRKPFVIIRYLVLVLLIFEALQFNKTHDKDVMDPWLFMILLLWILYDILVMVNVSYKFDDMPFLHKEQFYTFNEQGIILSGTNVSASYKWAQIIKVRQTRNYLLLYVNSYFYFVIKKEFLNPEQLKYILNVGNSGVKDPIPILKEDLRRYQLRTRVFKVAFSVIFLLLAYAQISIIVSHK